ncbi:SUF system Fe-S cluster assembly protein [Maricaulis sp. W15]|uniref:FeS assembly SUF system protein n=1 Tax=Maricaulis maris TaxID=74318 RepID=A0A495DM69_9PROT|nr:MULTISPECIES: SUF system Fe-S cluster assembly protein [Maricaulis]OLF73092.1 SUF system Fe-S cluster assembly protein [Maricaulis sp. W15]RKR03038.1 FeS assembly SUF system protein [Maricaulis maris]
MTERTDRDVIDLSAPTEAEIIHAAVSDSHPADGTGAIPADELARITDDVVEALKTVYDPEIPVDIYELGLIYKVDLEDDRTLKVQMSLTAPGCPVAGEMPGWVQDAVEKVDGVGKALVDLTFEPPWTPDRMSDEARLALNMF